MDKHRKAVIELIVSIELANKGATKGQKVMIEPPDWRLIEKLVAEIKTSFNHSMEYHYEQHLAREIAYRAANKPPEVAKA